jgi:hypothetical protein
MHVITAPARAIGSYVSKDTRAHLFASLADSNTLVAGEPFPAIGRVRRAGSSYVWAPVVFTDAPFAPPAGK